MTLEIAKNPPSSQPKRKKTKKSKKNRNNGNTVTDRSIHYAKIKEGLDKNGGPKRVVTIAYRVYPDRPGMNVEYAASMFRKDNDKEEYNRKNHVQTARGRLAVRPLYTTFVFSDEMCENLLETKVPKTKEERFVWSQSKEGKDWKEMRRRFDQQMATFLRKKVAEDGVKSKHRMRRSEVERARIAGVVPHHEHNNNERDARSAIMHLFSGLNATNGTTAVERTVQSGNGKNRGRRNVINRAIVSELESRFV